MTNTFDGPQLFTGPLNILDGRIARGWHGKYPLPKLIAFDATSRTQASSNAYNTVCSMTVPAGTMTRLSGWVDFMSWVMIYNNAGTYTYTSKIVITDGTQTDTAQGLADSVGAGATWKPYTHIGRFHRRTAGATGVYGFYYFADNVAAGQAVATQTVDFSKSTTWTFSIVMSTSHANVRWEHYHSSLFWQDVAI